VVQAYVLIQAEVGKSSDVANAIRDVAGVVRVDAVTGPYEVVVLAEAPDMDDLARMVVGRIQLVPGITRTVTCTIVHL
jgi:DNA-binding Lrp family transcriptional regulator